MPIYENHEEYWQDLKLIENVWKISAIIETPDSTAINLDNSILPTAITTSVIKTPNWNGLVTTNSLEPVSSFLPA